MSLSDLWLTAKLQAEGGRTIEQKEGEGALERGVVMGEKTTDLVRTAQGGAPGEDLVSREAKRWNNEAQTGDTAQREVSKPVRC